MRIALVSLARRGGMVHFQAELANALAAFCDAAVVISSSSKHDYFSGALRRIPVNTGGNALASIARFLYPRTWCDLQSRLSDSRIDLVHIVGVHQWNPGVAFLCRLMRKPLIYTVHDPQAHPDAPLSIRLADWLTTALADRVVVMTRQGRTQLAKRRSSQGRIEVIPHPMYSLFLRWRPRSSNARRSILFLGRVEPYKGVEMLVEAFQTIRDTIPGWSLTIAGNGSLPPLRMKRGDPRIRIINRYLSDSEVARLMTNAAFLVLPYTSATQSGVIALAQAFERPVITSGIEGLREMVLDGRTGVLLAPGDVHALARAMRSLATHKDRIAKMRRSLRIVGERLWNPRTIAEAHVRMYAKILREPVRS